MMSEREREKLYREWREYEERIERSLAERRLKPYEPGALSDKDAQELAEQLGCPEDVIRRDHEAVRSVAAEHRLT